MYTQDLFTAFIWGLVNEPSSPFPGGLTLKREWQKCKNQHAESPWSPKWLLQHDGLSALCKRLCQVAPGIGSPDNFYLNILPPLISTGKLGTKEQLRRAFAAPELTPLPASAKSWSRELRDSVELENRDQVYILETVFQCMFSRYPAIFELSDDLMVHGSKRGRTNDLIRRYGLKKSSRSSSLGDCRPLAGGCSAFLGQSSSRLRSS